MPEQKSSPAATIVTVVLLLFVGASVVYMALGGKSDENETGGSTTAEASGIVVRYFHATARCASCKWIEEQTKAMIAASFADADANGSLTFESLNYEAPENEEMVNRYKVAGLSLVVVGLDKGAETGFKNLDQMIGHIGDEAAFGEYLQTEIAAFLGDA